MAAKTAALKVRGRLPVRFRVCDVLVLPGGRVVTLTLVWGTRRAIGRLPAGWVAVPVGPFTLAYRLEG